jgi:hypothetical protein
VIVRVRGPGVSSLVPSSPPRLSLNDHHGIDRTPKQPAMEGILRSILRISPANLPKSTLRGVGRLPPTDGRADGYRRRPRMRTRKQISPLLYTPRYEQGLG